MALRETTELIDLKNLYPHLEFVDGSLYSEDELIELDGHSIIEAHYNDFDSFIPDGKDYIYEKFYGSYIEGFNSAE